MSETNIEEVNGAVDKLLGLKTYEVFASETVYYCVKIKAHNYEEACDLAHSDNMEFRYADIYEGDYFNIDAIEEVTED